MIRFILSQYFGKESMYPKEAFVSLLRVLEEEAKEIADELGTLADEFEKK